MSETKPLTREQLNDEIESAAKWVARRGGKGLRGEPLPNLMSAQAVEAIKKDQIGFYARVVWQRHYLGIS